MDYRNKEFDEVNKPVRKRIYASILDLFRVEYCPPNGFWSCLTSVLTYLSEVSVYAADPWRSFEATVFRMPLGFIKDVPTAEPASRHISGIAQPCKDDQAISSPFSWSTDVLQYETVGGTRLSVPVHSPML